MLNHGLIIAALFILIGFIYERRGTWQVTELRGLQKAAPVMAGVFTVVMMASIGVPGLNGFVERVPGARRAPSSPTAGGRWWPSLGVIVAAIYLLWAYQQVFHGEPEPSRREDPRPRSWLERLVMAPLIILIVFLGVYPKPVLDRINPSVNQLDRPRRAGRPAHSQPAVATRAASAAEPADDRAPAGQPRRRAARVPRRLAGVGGHSTMPPIRYLSILPI